MSGRSPSDEKKLKQHRCEGVGINYRPWIMVHEISPNSTCYTPINWKIGRQMHLISTGEMLSFFHTNWFDDVVDIREQFVLDYEETCEIAERLGHRPPAKRMTTDLMITLDAPVTEIVAISVKDTREELYGKPLSREIKRLEIEAEYWDRHNIPYILRFKEDYDIHYCGNIRVCALQYDPQSIQNDVHALQHLIIHKKIEVEMEKKRLDCSALLKIHTKEIDDLYDQLTEFQRRNWIDHNSKPIFTIRRK